ncbi:MAG: UPF0175 family protein [Chloroflexota bacterium]
MDTPKLLLEVPDDLANAIRIPSEERNRRVRCELAIRLYQKGRGTGRSSLSFGKARQLAEMNKWEFHLLLAAEGIERHYDQEEFQADLQTIEALSS